MVKRNFHNPFRRKKTRKRRLGQPPVLESKNGTRKRSQKEMPAYPSNRSRLRKSKSRNWRLYARRLILGGAAAGGLVFAYIFITLPNISELNTFSKTPSILLKSEDGTIIGSFGDIYGDYVRFSDIPKSLIDAVIATEDRNFYHHFGVDPFGLLRATFANIRAGHVVQGGSTITQQVAKNVFLTPDRNLVRKVKEMVLAIKLENRFSKEDILSIYLNRVYLGAGTYGVDAASRRYFDKSARELSLPESAILAGLLKAPSRFAPTSNPALSRRRAEQVIINMQEAGYLTEQQSIRARNDLAKRMQGRKRTSQSALYFCDWIMDQLPDYIGPVQRDIVVVTTLRPDWQAVAEKSINDVMDKEAASHRASQAALLSMTPDGAVRAMIGGRSYAESQFNRATQSLRQPGSSFKLFVYLAGLEAGYTPDSTVVDQPVTIRIPGGNWQPKNYTNKYLGAIPLRKAVAESINTISVQIAQQVGVGRVVSMARRLGVTSDLDPVPSIALGATEVSLVEMTSAYAHLASQGQLVTPYGILQIDTVEGERLYERQPAASGVALSSRIVGQMNELLEGVINDGTGKAARIGRSAAGKTGTTSDYRDAWFMGYTPDLVTGVWVGNDNNEAMKKVTGGMMPAQIWHNYMQTALANTPPHDLPTGGGFFSDVLPWQNDTVEAPHTEAQPQRTRKGGDLGNSFWDKLLR